MVVFEEERVLITARSVASIKRRRSGQCDTRRTSDPLLDAKQQPKMQPAKKHGIGTIRWKRSFNSAID